MESENVVNVLKSSTVG